MAKGDSSGGQEAEDIPVIKGPTPSLRDALLGCKFRQLRYDDLLERPEEKLKGVREPLGAQAGDVIVHRCVEKNNFERMAGRPRGHEDSESFFRKGVGGD